ncbi:hypothetical protein V8E53_007606 [Lactarius tabidus]
MCFEDQLSPISDPMTKGGWFSAALQLQGRVSMTSASTHSSASPSPAWTRQRARRHHTPGVVARLQGAAHELHAHIDGVEGHSFSYCRFGMHPCATACEIEICHSTFLALLYLASGPSLLRHAHRSLRLLHSNYVQPQKARLPGCEGQCASLGLRSRRRRQLVLQCPLLGDMCLRTHSTSLNRLPSPPMSTLRTYSRRSRVLALVYLFFHSRGSLFPGKVVRCNLRITVNVYIHVPDAE